MTSPDKEPSHPPDDDSNPFVAFRRFADEQVSSMLQNLVGLPSNSTRQNDGRWTAYDDQVRRTLGDWTSLSGGPQSSLHPFGKSQESSSTTNINDTNISAPGVSTTAPIREPGNTFHPFLPFSHTAWESYLNQWLFFDGYSPLNLVNDPNVDINRNWRAAFDDLLAADSEIDMPKRSEAEIRQKIGAAGLWNAHSQMQWRHAILEKYGAHPPKSREMAIIARDDAQQPAPTKDEATKEEENSTDNGPATELDMYERLCPQTDEQERDSGNGSGATQNQEQVSSLWSSSFTSRPEQTEGVVSTLATTERVSMPDGTVRTKIVLKKKFADGREESNETVSIEQGPSKASGSAQGSLTVQKDDDAAADEKKKGWFWS